MQTITLQEGKNKLKFVSRILEKIDIGPKPTEKLHPDPKKSFRIHNTVIFCVN